MARVLGSALGTWMAVLMLAAPPLEAAYTLPSSSLTLCRQVTADGVSIRTGAGVGYAAGAEKLYYCYRIHYLGPPDVRADGYDWAKIWWNGAPRWVAATYLTSCNGNCPSCQSCQTAQSYLVAAGLSASAAGQGACLAYYESGYAAKVHVNSNGSKPLRLVADQQQIPLL
jgi:hypothetical protein